MAVIKPFRAVRYNPAFIGDYRGVVTPPYDLIDPCNRQKYHEASPYNSIRLILGLDKNGDHDRENRFVRAARCWTQWRAEEILIQDEQPGFYVYEQEFNSPPGGIRRRLGLVCLLRLEDYENKVVLPHERTFPGPKADLVRLLEATQANFSQIFCFYQDRAGSIEDLLKAQIRIQPKLEVTDEEEVIHRLWPIYSPAIINHLQSYFSDKQVFIADGHHRYESALEYSRRLASGSDKPHDFVLAALFNADEDLTILPTHRLVGEMLATETKLNKASRTFQIERLPANDPPGKYPAILAQRPGSFICYGGRDQSYLMRLRSPAALKELESYAPACRRLDVSILHAALLDGLFQPGRLGFTQDVQTAVKLVDRGSYLTAFLLNPTPVESIMAVAQSGSIMPPKSTYFFPKLLSGLVMYAWA